MAEVLRADFEAVLRHVPAGIAILEAPGGRAILGNERLAQLWKHAYTDFHSFDWYPARRGFRSDGRPYAADEWPITRSLRSGEVVEGEEIEIERADGTRGTIRESSTPMRNGDGEIVAAVATTYDITEQKRQEVARRFLGKASELLAGSLDYETTLQNVAQLAVPTLADWCSVDISREDGRIDRLAVEHLQATKARLARDLARRYPWDPRAPAGVARVIRTGRSELIPRVTDELLRTLARDADHLRLLRAAGMRSAMVVPLRGRERSLGAVVFITAESRRTYGHADLEIAEELAARAALAIDNAMLYHESQAANRAKSDFLAIVSHELRTPLTAVIGYAELLALGVPDALTPRQKDHVDRIEVSASHLLMLIEEILTMISLESGELRLRTQTFPLGQVLRKAEVIIRPAAEAKGLSLKVAASDLVVNSDPERLLQVLLNVLSNAVKFTEDGGVELDVADEHDSVAITIRDSGIGMDAAHLDRIFEPFWQVEQPITRKAGGTGLGLSISRGLVRRLGGTLAVRSIPDRGSAFTLRLPTSLHGVTTMEAPAAR